MKFIELRDHINNMTEKQLNDIVALKICDAIFFAADANMIFRHNQEEIGCDQPYIDLELKPEDLDGIV